jgi:NitT/TauT family transport system substrate-binding protein
MALLGTGELKAAMLPEPLSSLAVQNGARPILDDTTKPEISYSTYAFRKPVIDQHPDAIRAFLAAIEEAITLINQDPQKWSTLLVDQKVVPQPIAGSFQIPTFVTAGVPSQAQWDDVLAWALAKGLIEQELSYKDSVTDKYLPK